MDPGDEREFEAAGSPDVAPPVLAGPAFGLSSLRSSPAAGGRVESSERESGDVIPLHIKRAAHAVAESLGQRSMDELHAMNNHPAGKGRKRQ